MNIHGPTASHEPRDLQKTKNIYTLEEIQNV